MQDDHAPDQQRIEEIGEQLRAKIASKFSTTAFLAGFSLTLLGLELSMLWSNSRLPLLLPYAIGALVFAIVLYARALMRLDELTMPKRFWEEGSGDHDPALSHLGLLTDGDLWALADRMVYYWYRLVHAALWVTGFSLALILVPVESPEPMKAVSSALVASAIAAILSVVYIQIFASERGKEFAPLTRPSD
jgi:hypothetical protein